MDCNPLPMLRLLTLPASWLTLLETLRPVFRRSSTFRTLDMEAVPGR